MTDILNLLRVVSLRGTKANVEALTADLEETTIAWATDTSEIGIYTNATWEWIGAGALDYGEDGDITAQDFGDVADAGVLDEVARADHLHGMPSATGGGGGFLLIADVHSSPIIFDDILQADDYSDLLYSEA